MQERPAKIIAKKAYQDQLERRGEPAGAQTRDELEVRAQVEGEGEGGPLLSEEGKEKERARRKEKPRRGSSWDIITSNYQLTCA